MQTARKPSIHRPRLFSLFALSLAVSIQPRASAPDAAGSSQDYLSPTALATGSNTLFVACATANIVAEFDVNSSSITRRTSVPPSPLGLALSRDGTRLFVTCAAPSSRICEIDVATGRIRARIPTGHTAMAPVLAVDEKTLYVCNRFADAVAFIDLASQKEVARVKVAREPVAAARTKDGKYLLVANHIHGGRADIDVVAAAVTVIDTAVARVVKEIALPNGSTLLRDVQVSPDGKYACVTHLLARSHLPTTQIERGWIQSNALSLIDLAEMRLINTVLLDNIDHGAANPWAAIWTRDGKYIVVSHAGTHELSLIDAPALFAKLSKFPAAPNPNDTSDQTLASRSAADIPDDLSFLVGLRTRIKLHGKGPRALAVVNNAIYVANYFSDSLDVLNLNPNPHIASIPLVSSSSSLSLARLGERYFNDATLCFQEWLSCASCHSSDARVDGRNWDLLNDGIGNPKNAKNLLLAHQTPPTTSLGVRENAKVSVRAGIKNILFAVQPEEVAEALDEYLQSLKPIPSPHLVNGQLSESAARGKTLFNDEVVGCADCHKPGLFTNLKSYDVGTRGKFDKPTNQYDTPSLIEVWRSAPYLHDGSAATVRDVITARNSPDRHGATSHLSSQQIDDLVSYVLSL